VDAYTPADIDRMTEPSIEGVTASKSTQPAPLVGRSAG
jgi:hypothetical protein